MTDNEALRQYTAAKKYRDVILAAKVPQIFGRDPEILERFRSITLRGIEEAEKIMRQAERAVDQLPRETWRNVLACRFLQGLDEYKTAEALFFCERSVLYQQKHALEYLETGKDPASAGRRPDGP